ncbi:hypothetical protein DFH08DRAFT_953616 [Mycena albidolilacea]|uniref:Uncharacterized protein n=1 Tax=Mycena albidolilacea TaxID=1033008 RepID=A0AAD7AH07_9AGAR|nr:hypothetical protein DFH08DRAFT_953616 [Mycena albidolilacea]
MRFVKTAIFLQLICIVGIYGAAVHDEKETNAARFRRGLGPLPPTRREHNDLSPRASAAPCTRLSNNVGTLQIRRLSNGERIGYLGKRFNRDNAYTVRPQPRAALRVTVPPITPFGVVINLIVANAPDSGHPYLGAVDAGHGTLGDGEAGFAILSGTSGARMNSPPSSDAGTSLTLRHGGIESQIWKMNCQTRQITAQWTNTGGGQPRTAILYDPVHKLLALSGDPQAYEAAMSRGAYEVMITFVPE